MLLILTEFNTFIASAPSGEASQNHVISGDNVTYTCRVSYVSSSVLKMWWTDTATGRTVSPPGGRVSTDDLRSSLIRLESSLTVTVPQGAREVQPYRCVVASLPLSSTQSNGLTDWNSTAITVYCEWLDPFSFRDNFCTSSIYLLTDLLYSCMIYSFINSVYSILCLRRRRALSLDLSRAKLLYHDVPVTDWQTFWRYSN